MVTRNPCLKCLIQACCSQECKKIESYQYTIASVGVISFIIGLIFSVVTPILFCLKYDFMPITKITIIFFVWSFVLFLLRYLAYKMEGDEIWDTPEYVIMAIFGPALMVAWGLVAIFEFYSKPDDSISLLS